MNSTQIVITSLYVVAVIVAVLISVFVIRSTAARQRRRPGAEIETIVKRENRYALGVAAALFVLLISTLVAIPYGERDAQGGQIVTVDAFQFGWTLSPKMVTTGEQVVFVTRSKDVQHGFGLYDDTTLLKQVQVPANRPGSETEFGDQQRMTYTFEHPGTYQINCLEFCGVGHHLMTAEINVVGGS
jgi:cytochrome c oxidase subunit 2